MDVLMDEQLNRGTKDGCVNGWAIEERNERWVLLIGEQLNRGTKHGGVYGWAIKQRNEIWVC